MSWMRKPWMKWAMPIGALALVAALVTGGLAMTGGTAVSEGDDWDVEYADINPAYASTAVVPSEVLPAVLYSVEVSPETAVVAAGGGDAMEIIVENLIEEPLANLPPAVVANGDLTGDVVVTANIYTGIPDGTGTILEWTTLPPVVVPVTNFVGLTVHPGRTITLLVPIVALPGTPVGTLVVYDAAFVNVVGP